MHLTLTLILLLETAALAPGFLIISALGSVEGFDLNNPGNVAGLAFLIYSTAYVTINIFIIRITTRKPGEKTKSSFNNLKKIIALKLALIASPWTYSLLFESFDGPLNLALSIVSFHTMFTGLIFKPLMYITYPIIIIFNALLFYTAISPKWNDIFRHG